MCKARGIDGEEIAAGDVVESANHQPHVVINCTQSLIMYKAKDGHIRYRPARKYRRIEMARKNFVLYRYQYNPETKRWGELNIVTFYTRAHTLDGVARAIRSVSVPINTDTDLLIGHGYIEHVDKLVRFVYRPKTGYAKAFFCDEKGHSEEYDVAKVKCRKEVEESLCS